jgi:outer membrane protein OmpA-like peptidoglycan-associated protein
MNLRFISSRWTTSIATVVLALTIFTSCKPDGYINKVKYDGEKYINTCTTFQADIEQLIAKNSDPLQLSVSEYDNTDFRYFYLEPGQFEQMGDTLYFRLRNDLDYNEYLAQRVAVHVNASVQSAEKLSDLDGGKESLGTLVVDEDYFLLNKKPFFAYKFALDGKTIAGKQILLTFAIAKYDSKGNVKKYFCETDANPIGTAKPSCCVAQRWENTSLQTVASLPEIEVESEKFKYESFTGTIDVQFEESSADLEDDTTFSANVIQYHVEKYDGYGYGLERIDMTGYASPGGRESYNQKLSEKRANSLKKGLQELNEGMENLEVTAVGKGEDWERVKLLTGVSSLTEAEQQEVLDICNDESLTNDEKEAKLRKVPFWETLVPEVLVKARHTFTIMDFDYAGDVPTHKRYIQRHPVASTAMEEVAAKVFDLKPVDEASDKTAAREELEAVLTETATPNLYAMRATYHVADKDYKSAISDLEKASRFRGPEAEQFNTAIQGYKVLIADEYDFSEKRELFNDLQAKVEAAPQNTALQTNLALMMDKIGYLKGALKQYNDLSEMSGKASYLVNRGVTKVKANMITEAEADFLEAIKIEPNNGPALFNLAATSAYKGLTFKTIDYLDKAIAVNPDYRDMIFNNPVFSVLSEDPRFDKYRQ